MADTFHGWPTRAPSGRIAYVNGRYLPHAHATVHIEDRGLQFADAIYEVFGVIGGLVRDEEEHLDRLERSVSEIGMAMPMGRAAMKLVMRELVRRNRFANGLIYMQVTRGAARRDHPVPNAPPRPTLILTARPIAAGSNEKLRAKGIRVVTKPDERWARRDIKSTALLPNILAKTAARRSGAFEAWLIDADGFVTEGASTTAWIVDREGRIVTRPLSNAILPGVTRRIMLEAASSAQIPVIERAFTPAEARTAAEAFISAATIGAVPVTEIDGQKIGEGAPGPVTRRVQDLYQILSDARAHASKSV
ncbi:MAG TPA: D-amino-acid transaminase [Rhizomicrobium sp.]|nr:D-amino-acid transaminase [Rhizomicrobium sp.]